MSPRLSTLLPFLIVIYCAWNARALIDGWLSAPYEQGIWFLFALWLVPLIIFWGHDQCVPNVYFLGLALGTSLLSTLVSMNALAYVGLAFALAAFLPWSPLLLVWLIGALSWMPAFGWIGSHYFPSLVGIVRIGLASLSSLCLLFTYWRTKKV